jgi:hypothetical protein
MKKITKEQARNRAIEIASGKYLTVGAIVGSLRDDRTWRLDSFDEHEAHLSIHEEKMTVPTAEVFDVKKVINIGNHMLNLGYWKEGMEHSIIGIHEHPRRD